MNLLKVIDEYFFGDGEDGEYEYSIGSKLMFYGFCIGMPLLALITWLIVNV